MKVDQPKIIRFFFCQSYMHDCIVIMLLSNLHMIKKKLKFLIVSGRRGTPVRENHRYIENFRVNVLLVRVPLLSTIQSESDSFSCSSIECRLVYKKHSLVSCSSLYTYSYITLLECTMLENIGFNINIKNNTEK